MNINARRPMPIDPLELKIQTPPQVIAWKPNVVVAPTMAAATDRAVTAGEPALRPEALKAQIGATRALLQSLAAAQASLEVGTPSTSGYADAERERVAVAAEAYRLESVLDRVLLRTFDEVIALMNERGLA